MAGWFDANLVSILNGFAIGSLLFILAVGLSIVFGMMDVLNLAHGALYLVGAYVAFSLLRDGSSWGAFLSGASFVFFFGIVYYTLRYGQRVTEPQYWGPQPDPSLEWTLPNPPPAHTFETLPTAEVWDKQQPAHH